MLSAVLVREETKYEDRLCRSRAAACGWCRAVGATTLGSGAPGPAKRTAARIHGRRQPGEAAQRHDDGRVGGRHVRREGAPARVDARSGTVLRVRRRWHL